MMLLAYLIREAVKYGAVRWLGVTAYTPTFTDNNAWAFVSNLLLLHSLGVHDHLTFNGPSWSISAEFYAYVLLALILLALRNRAKAAQLTAFLIVSVSSLAFLLFVHPRDLNTMYDFGWFRCTMGFFLGAASYIVLMRFDPLRRPGLRRLASYVAIVGLVGGALFLQYKVKGPSDYFFSTARGGCRGGAGDLAWHGGESMAPDPPPDLSRQDLLFDLHGARTARVPDQFDDSAGSQRARSPALSCWRFTSAWFCSCRT